MTSKQSMSVTLEGDLSVRTVADMKQRLEEALAGSRPVILNAHTLTGIDAAALQLLVAARKSALASGKSLGIDAPAGGVLHQALARYGLLPADPDPADAETAFWMGQKPRSEAA
jgi:ABC-type transporter Mla MlaB component